MKTTVVNQLHTSADVYIGRGKGAKGQFGNPFASKPTKAPWTIQVDSDKLACDLFRAWLTGCDAALVKQYTGNTWLTWQAERRRNILSQIYKLSGCSLGCFCVSPRNPKADCHGFVLADLADIQAMAWNWLQEQTQRVWTFEQVQALGWTRSHDLWPVADGWTLKPWASLVNGHAIETNYTQPIWFDSLDKIARYHGAATF